MSGGRGGLRRFVDDPGVQGTRGAATEKCEMCGTPVGERHGHVVDVEHRSLVCACRPCFLLFTRDSATGRFRAVPDRYLYDPARPVTAAQWESLRIPVGAAFFLRGEHGVAAFYPSPAGATECLLDLEVWAELAAAHPLLSAAVPEVEAILIRNGGDGGGGRGNGDGGRDGAQPVVECFLVPIDACYELVGTVRMYWQGFDGGQEARERIAEFYAGVRSRARQFVLGA
jgi:hypothetical protein